MRKYILLISLIIPVFLLSNCSRQTGNEVSPGKEFTLNVGKSVTITGEKVDIKFVKVVSDSRCPQGVTCIWAGEVSCLVEITQPSIPTFQLTLTEPGLTGQPPTKTFDGYKIEYRVEPYPVAGKAIAESDYKLIMTVTRGN